MKTITLQRISTTQDGTFGVMLYEKVPFLLTLERPWRDNARGISSIPDGSYRVKRTVTPKHGNTFEVQDVPGRSAILIHTGNTEVDVEGCIVVGMQFGRLDAKDPDTGQVESQPAVLRSKDGYDLLNNFIGKDDEFLLIISWC